MSGPKTVTSGSIVSIHYKLSLDDGQVVDSSEASDPLAYLHGAGNIVRGLENALEGQNSGAKISVTVSPADGYGVRDDGAVQDVSRGTFPDDAELEVGLTFQAVDEDQNPLIGTVRKIDGDQITVDFNHPLAGQILHFEVEVTDVREATDVERQHGHSHGPGGHAH